MDQLPILINGKLSLGGISLPVEYVAMLAYITAADGSRAADIYHANAVSTLMRAGIESNVGGADSRWIREAVTVLLNTRKAVMPIFHEWTPCDGTEPGVQDSILIQRAGNSASFADLGDADFRIDDLDYKQCADGTYLKRSAPSQ